METCPHCKKQFNYSPIYHGVGQNDHGDYSCYDCLSDRDKAAYDAFFGVQESMEVTEEDLKGIDPIQMSGEEIQRIVDRVIANEAAN